MAWRNHAVGGLLWWALAGSGHAAIFEDGEARKAILDLRARVTALEGDQKKDQAAFAEQARAAAQLNEQITLLRRGMLDLANQIEALRAEVAKLRGGDENLTRELADQQRRQREALAVLEERVRKLEPLKVSIEGQETVVDAAEKKAFDDAMAQLRTGDFDKTAASLNTFLRRYPASGYADLARFWLGNALYGKRDYAGAIAAFRQFFSLAPNHPRVPESWLAIANSQAEMKDKVAARRTLEDILKTYPATEAAQAARERLPGLK
jgi:tol-pal system protein YbgF